MIRRLETPLRRAALLRTRQHHCTPLPRLAHQCARTTARPPVAAASWLRRADGNQLARRANRGLASSSSAAAPAAVEVRDVQHAATLLGETLRELEMLTDASGDGGLGTLPGPSGEQHDRLAAQLGALLGYCEAELREIKEWDGKRRGQTSAYKHHATVAPLHAQVLLATGQARLVLPPPHTDVAGALQFAEAGFGALHALLEAATNPPSATGGAPASQPAEAATRAARVHMLRGALQLSATRLRYAAEVAPQMWVAQGRAVIELLRELLPDFEEAFGAESTEVLMALQAVRQSYTEVGEAFFHGVGCEQSDEKAVQCCEQHTHTERQRRHTPHALSQPRKTPALLIGRSVRVRVAWIRDHRRRAGGP